MRYVLPCGDDYLVLMPEDGLLFRTNAEATRRFQQMEQGNIGPEKPAFKRPLPTTQVTIVTSLECSMRCLYCPVRIEQSALRMDPDFCAAGCRLVAANAGVRRLRPKVVFHGMGEPTSDWNCFRRCVDAALAAGTTGGVPPNLVICTAGQLEESQARFICEHFQEVQVSLDGPPDVQMLYRKRKDGDSSFEAALRTAQLAADFGCRTVINVTVTDATVGRMADIVRFAGEEIGRVAVCFESVFITPSMHGKIQAPEPTAFVDGFANALDVGDQFSVVVRHSTISIESLVVEFCDEMSPLILLPDGTVRDRIEFGSDGKMLPNASVCGRYHADTRTIKFTSHSTDCPRKESWREECECCACSRACNGGSLILTSFPSEDGNRPCDINRGVLTVLLERATRKSVRHPSSLFEETVSSQR